MKQLVSFICLLFTQTLIAQPYTSKWSEISKMPMAEQVWDILYNGKDVFFFTNHLLVKYNGSTLKEEFQGDFPMPALTGDLSKEKQVLVRAYILGGKLWLI